MEVLEAEAPLTVLGASSFGSEDSKRNGAIAGAAIGHLRDRLTGSVLIAVEGSAPRQELVSMAAIATGAGPSAVFVAAAPEGTSKSDVL